MLARGAGSTLREFGEQFLMVVHHATERRFSIRVRGKHWSALCVGRGDFDPRSLVDGRGGLHVTKIPRGEVRGGGAPR